jgi:hypothetical protein
MFVSRWEASVRHTFQRVDPTESTLKVRLTDSRGGAFRREMRLLGEATIHCSHIKVRGSRAWAGWLGLEALCA